jgi:hypothetical protein
VASKRRHAVSRSQSGPRCRLGRGPSVLTAVARLLFASENSEAPVPQRRSTASIERSGPGSQRSRPSGDRRGNCVCGKGIARRVAALTTLPSPKSDGLSVDTARRECDPGAGDFVHVIGNVALLKLARRRLRKPAGATIVRPAHGRDDRRDSEVALSIVRREAAGKTKAMVDGCELSARCGSVPQTGSRPRFGICRSQRRAPRFEVTRYLRPVVIGDRRTEVTPPRRSRIPRLRSCSG